MKQSKTKKVPAQIFERDLSESGWIYRNKSDHVFALKARIFGFDLLAFDDFLERELSSPKSKDVLAWMVKRRSQASAAIESKNLPLAKAILEVMHVYYQLVSREDYLLPKARHGAKFVAKKQGAAGAVRKAIETALKANPKLTPEKVWEQLKAKPPQGLEFYGTGAARHIWREGRKDTGWRRFQNIVSDEKTKLKG